MIPLAAFACILTAACLHASWNVVIRSMKGNTAVLVLAHCYGSLLLIPFALSTPGFWEMFNHPDFWFLMTISAGCQAFYNLLIAAAYVVGDVGLIYPLARGTAIILATIISQLIGLDGRLSIFEVSAITLIIFGIAGLCFESLNATSREEKGEIHRRVGENELGPRMLQNKVLMSMFMAVCVGTCTGSYSIADSMSVKLFPMVPWYCVSSVLSSIILIPCILTFYYGKTVDALTNHKLTTVLITPPVIGAYMIILYVFTFPGINVALVVSVREFSVVIGALLGVFFLKEPVSMVKFGSIFLMMVGMMIVKIL